MAHVPKYRHEFCNRYGTECRVDILEDDYEGPIIDVEAGPSPVVITYESQDDFKFSQRRSSTAIVTFVGATQFELTDLWTSDERKFRVEVWVDNLLYWRGYVVPNGFRQDFTGGLYYAQITASDGLSTLDGMRFAEVEGDPTVNPPIPDTNYDGRWTFKDLASEILRKLQLDLNLWIGVDVYHLIMDKGPDDDPLAQCNVHARTYISDSVRDDIPYWQDPDVAFDCGVVLDNLLTIWNAKIYQSWGSWRIKRVNADENDDPIRYWRKYNSLGVFLESEPIDENLLIPCNGPDPVLLDGATLSMDRVFKQTKVNYKFTYFREGDTPINMFRNGTFSSWPNPTGGIPTNWTNTTGNPISVEQVLLSTLPGIPPAGLTYGAQVTSQAAGSRYLFQRVGEVSSGDNILLRWHQRATGGPSQAGDAFMGLYSITIDARNPNGTGNYYSLVNDGVLNANGSMKTRWVNETEFGAGPLYFNVGSAQGGFWRKLELEIPPVPETGRFIFRIAGMARLRHNFQGLFRTFLPDPNQIPTGDPAFSMQPVYPFHPDNAMLIVSGFFAGLIRNVSSEEVPDVRSFVSINRDGFYTDQFEPFEILNADRESIDHISHIELNALPGHTGTTKQWDTIDLRYFQSAIGLITAKSIQDQYGKPQRMIEGGIKAEEIEFGTRISFQNDPDIAGIRFVIQRGSFDIKENIFDGTLVEISASEVPPGGTDGGNNTDPDWQPTGNTRCIKDGSGLNTGATEFQEIDVNEASPTFGQTRWTEGDVDTDMCPIGEPNFYYWGAQPLNYDPDEFMFSPFFESEESGYLRVISVNFNNEGGDYLYFLHRDNLGLITRVEGAFQGNTISDWQYLSDTVIDGFTYRVFRQNYPTGIFQDLSMSFFFE